MKYLISCGPGIGDVVQYLPLARCIKEADMNNEVDIIVSGNKERIIIVNELLQYQNYIGDAYYYSKDELLHSLRLILKLLDKQYDYGIIRIDNSTGKSWTWIEKIMRIVRCKEIVGNIKSLDKNYIFIPQRIHYKEKCSCIAKKLGISSVMKERNIDIVKLPKIKHLKQGKSGVVVGFSIGTNSVLWREKGKSFFYDVKSWPIRKWLQLVDMLVEEGINVILLGGVKEKNEIEKEKITIPDNDYINNFIGKTTIGESLSLLRKCSLVVGAEGGMLHCANSLGIKTLTLYGGSDYKQWNPGGKRGSFIVRELECYPCFGTKNAALCKNHKCLELISVQLVRDKIIEILKGSLFKSERLQNTGSF